ncbi:ssDNA-binding protein [Brevibacillus agri]
MSNQDPKRVVTGKVRLSYVHLFTPFANQPGAEPKYSVTLLIPKSDIATKQRIDAAIQAAIQDGVSSRWNGVRPPQVHLPLHDGDGVRPSDGMPFSDECKGHWVMTASTKDKPEIVDLNLNPIINQSEVYSGMYGHVSIRFFAYNSNGKKGIGCGLGNVQKVEDGEPLGGGRASAAADFASLTGQAPAPAYGQPPAYPPQPGYGSPQQPQQAQPGGWQVQTPQGWVNASPQRVYGQPPQQSPMYPPQQGYGQAPTQPPVYPQQPTQFDPITGKPLNGGIMGL